jgi:hypothetical protein
MAIDPLESALYAHRKASEPDLLQAAEDMLAALESIEAWDDLFGSESIAADAWQARDALRTAVKRTKATRQAAPPPDRGAA